MKILKAILGALMSVIVCTMALPFVLIASIMFALGYSVCLFMSIMCVLGHDFFNWFCGLFTIKNDTTTPMIEEHCEQGE